MASELTPEFVRGERPADDAEAQAAMLAEWHRRKTAIYTQMVAEGVLPTRPGIRRIITEAQDAGWKTGRRVDVGGAIGPRDPRAGRRAGTGGPVRRWCWPATSSRTKKPAPDIYLLALERLGVDAADVLVIEDSRNGLLAATGAGLRCVMTVNGYTEEEDNSEAVLVVTSLGDPDGERTRVIANRSAATPGRLRHPGRPASCLRPCRSSMTPRPRR